MALGLPCFSLKGKHSDECVAPCQTCMFVFNMCSNVELQLQLMLELAFFVINITNNGF